MREAEKKRLIELLDQNCGYVEEQKAGELADYLLDNGVIVPFYEIGQKVYVIGNELIWRGEICKFWYSKDDSCERFRFDVLFSDKTVETISERDIFLTEAEAKYALKNRRSVSLVNGHIEE